MNMKYKLVTVLVVLLVFMTACSDFLDTTPDNRTELNTPEQVGELLASAYPTSNYSMLCELSSDNFEDNNSPDANGLHFLLDSEDRMHDEAFAWEDVVSGDEEDSPSAVWSGCYLAIASANHALKVVERFEAEGRGDEIKAQKGEALLIRAYYHFVLANVFAQAYKNDELSKNDLAIPYVTEPGTIVSDNYVRESVTDVYDKIEKDLLAGIDLIDDKAYSVVKYHFNRQAANAFAARFYLYKRNYEAVVKYATAALGDTPANVMRDWMSYEGMTTSESRAAEWINAQQRNNFLLVPTNSVFSRVCGSRYGCTRDAGKGSINGGGPTWNYTFHPCYQVIGLYYRKNQDYGFFLPKLIEFFEYTDKVAKIGYPHIVRCEFTAEETILCRAEAYVYLNNLPGALADLKVWDDSRKILPGKFTFSELTESLIKSFYTDSKTLFVKKLNSEKMSPDFTISAAQLPYIRCILHFRRLETMFDGYRWFDVKRYGIEIERKIGVRRVEYLTWDDARRALQIPAEVISAGMPGNIRVVAPIKDPAILTNGFYEIK